MLRTACDPLETCYGAYGGIIRTGLSGRDHVYCWQRSENVKLSEFFKSQNVNRGLTLPSRMIGPRDISWPVL